MLDRIIKRSINGTEYTVMPLATKAGGLDIYRKLHKYLGPVVGGLIRLVGEAQKGAVDPAEIGPGVVQAIVEHLSSSMGDPEFCAILDKMFGVCAVRGGPISAEHWDTHLGDHDELAACCLWVNYVCPFLLPKLQSLGIDLDRVVGTFKFPLGSTLSSRD